MNMKTRNDLPFFLNDLGLTGLGVEVGVLRGEFSKYILNFWNGKKLYLIDSWTQIPGIIDINNVDYNGNLNNLANTFKNIYSFKQKATIIRDFSVNASTLFRDNQLDFVYLDAAHNYKNVKEDLNVWYPKIKNEGYFMGHDYVNGMICNSEFQVKIAVDEFAKENNLLVYSTCETDWPSWYFKKQE